MNNYKITNKSDGAHLGTWEAESDLGAWQAMLDNLGTTDQAEALSEDYEISRDTIAPWIDIRLIDPRTMDLAMRLVDKHTDYHPGRPVCTELLRACHMCKNELPEGASLSENSRLAFGITSDGALQLWCSKHGCNVMHFDFMAALNGLMDRTRTVTEQGDLALGEAVERSTSRQRGN